MKKFIMRLIALLSCIFFSSVSFADINTGIIAYYPFDGDVLDASGNGHDGSINYNNPCLGEGQAKYFTKQGAVNDAFILPPLPLDEYYIRCEGVGLTDFPQLHSSLMSIAFWFKKTSHVTGQILGQQIIKMSDAYGLVDPWTISYDSSLGGVSYEDNFADTQHSIPDQIWPEDITSVIEQGGWNHYVFTFDPVHTQEDRIYFNGKIIFTEPTINTGLKYYNSYFVVGYHPYYGQNYAEGQIDELIFYNRVLSEEEIQVLYPSDLDNDGIANKDDNCPNDPNPKQYDYDGDGIGIVCDQLDDPDNDGISTADDNCPNDPNPKQYDYDGDGIGIVCDNVDDPDNDGISTAADNCPGVANPKQYDLDGDGIGLVCDSSTIDDHEKVNRFLSLETASIAIRARFIALETSAINDRERFITLEADAMQVRERFIVLEERAIWARSRFILLEDIANAVREQDLHRDDDGDGYSEKQNDCNDNDFDINPGVIEISCDGIDQDCNGTDLECPDDVDDDNDGYTENQGDCDDTNSTVYPGRTEICRDGIDQDCDGSDVVCPIPTVILADGTEWMDRNLGAAHVARGAYDEEAYGDLYQWGRLADGHEKRSSATTTTLSSTDVPGHGDFIIGDHSDHIYDWRESPNNDLWQGTQGINNPCPPGFRIPAYSEISFLYYCSPHYADNATYTFVCPIKLTGGGQRNSQGEIINGLWGGKDGLPIGYYWTSRTRGDVIVFEFFASGLWEGDQVRNVGNSVRCIKD